VRALVVSHHYADASRRRKLHALAGLGWSVVAAVPGGAAGTEGAIQLVPIPVRGTGRTPAQQRWSSRAVRRLLTDVRPQVVQIEEEPGTHGAWVTAVEAHRLKIPVVLFSWESLPRRRSFLERRRYQATLARATGLIGGNRLALAQLASAAPGRPGLALPQFGVMPPPPPVSAPPSASPPAANVGPEAAAGPISPPLTLACVGRLVPERGVDLLLRACAQLMGAWSLAIVGTGPQQEALEALAQRLGLASRLRWLGSLSRIQVTALWNQVDCLVVPSRSTPTWVERHSPILLEAMAHGRAVVVTNEGALPELVGEAGVIVRNEEELLIALQQLVSEPSWRLALGQAARRRVLERYVDAAIARATEELWREVLTSARGRGNTVSGRDRKEA
jgi:glycosyltransferase involved in cell wall biosynthesis